MKELVKTGLIVVVAIIVVKVLDRLFLESALDKVLPSNFEDFEDFED